MKVLITGVAGLIGSKTADWLFKNKPEIKIVGIDDLSGGYRENVHPQVELYIRNLVSDKLDDIFQKYNFDYVFHFAAYAAENLSPFIRTYNYQNNIVASVRLISKSIEYNVKRFIFTSSIAVYGRARPPFRERYIPNPIDPYGIAKFAVEMDLRIAYEQHGLEYCILRPYNVYGDKQNIWDKYRNVMGIWMYQLLNNQPITIFGDGTQRRAFTYVEDILGSIWNSAVLESMNNEVINLGSPKDFSINEAADMLLEIVGRGNKIYLPSRREAKYAWCTCDKAKKLLGFRYKTSLKEGLTKMWEWAKAQPKRIQKVWNNYELNKGLYDFWKIE